MQFKKKAKHVKNLSRLGQYHISNILLVILWWKKKTFDRIQWFANVELNLHAIVVWEKLLLKYYEQNIASDLSLGIILFETNLSSTFFMRI